MDRDPSVATTFEEQVFPLLPRATRLRRWNWYGLAGSWGWEVVAEDGQRSDQVVGTEST